VALAFSGATAALAQEACRDDTVMLRGDWGSVRFSVEVADDSQEQQQGLMNREAMANSAGMLFVYDSPRTLSFWMRNTLIPLDMLFIDRHGVVQNIHHMAKPLDETPIFGGDDLLSTLEINGGLAKRLGITVGSQVRHPAFAEYLPAWPC
tara:strand:- start:97 stop:546 length:450 start_codon:yes stop_codon:yes gene_type:complete